MILELNTGIGTIINSFRMMMRDDTPFGLFNDCFFMAADSNPYAIELAKKVSEFNKN